MCICKEVQGSHWLETVDYFQIFANDFVRKNEWIQWICQDTWKIRQKLELYDFLYKSYFHYARIDDRNVLWWNPGQFQNTLITYTTNVETNCTKEDNDALKSSCRDFYGSFHDATRAALNNRYSWNDAKNYILYCFNFCNVKHLRR